LPEKSTSKLNELDVKLKEIPFESEALMLNEAPAAPELLRTLVLAIIWRCTSTSY
jgi:hypothetical protein